MAPNATATAVSESTLPLQQHPCAFQGDGDGMVDLLVDACVRAKEVQREQALAGGGAPPRAGRELVPYFKPDSTDWGLEDVNTNTDGVESDSLDGSSSSRGYDSCTSTGVRRRAGKERSEALNVPSKNRKSRKASKRGKKQAASPTDEVPPLEQPMSVPLPPSAELTSRFAGTAYGLASPPPESLPLPTSALLAGAVTRKVTTDPVATQALRGLLQLEKTTPTPACVLLDDFHRAPSNPVCA